MENKKSIKINALFSAIKTMLAVLFPLITFPYITRTIGIDNYGKISFSTSIITYFAMIAALGINNYAIREGASKKNNKRELEEFASEIFSINLVTTVISYMLLVILMLFWNKLQTYSMLIIIQAVGIISTTIGVEWLYTIHEEFLYIAIRYMIVQVISLILLFVLVRNESDYWIYAVIIVFSNGGANIFNYIHSCKYCKLRFTLNIRMLNHLKSILILFFYEVSILIYVNSDITILGIFCSDYMVGMYSVAAKIYSIIKSVINSILIVAIPRLSSLAFLEKENGYTNLLQKIQKALLLITIPSVLGVIILSSNIIQIVSGHQYIEAAPSLCLLGIALLCSIGASFFGYILLTQKKEKLILISTSVAAAINIVLNIILIPRFGAIAAAGTTIVSEFIVLVINMYNVNDIYKVRISKREIMEVIVIVGMIFLGYHILNKVVDDNLVVTVGTFSIGVLGMIISLFLFKDELIFSTIKEVKTRLKIDMH